MTNFQVHREILTYSQSSANHLKEVTPEERIFVYYMFRASLPFNHMYRDQNHPKTNAIIELMTHMRHRCIETLAFSGFLSSVGPRNLLKDIETYLTYLWSNHGFYLLNEYENNKRTPKKIGLEHLSSDLVDMFEDLQYLAPEIFADDVDPEMSTDHIKTSGNNFYKRGFTEEMYKALPPEVQSCINAYPTENGGVMFRCVNGKNSSELQVVVYWLSLALHHVMMADKSIFDEYFISALKYLIQYFVTGDEAFFKLHCIEWVKTNSRLDWTMGFIETYHDPKKIRGHAGAEITIKLMDMSKLNPVLLQMEQRLPFPDGFRRDVNSASTINVSLNYPLHGAGDYGPSDYLAAYCLPNYDEIRSKHGSKQIIYKTGKSAGELLNPELRKKIKPKSYANLPFDTDQLFEDLWDLQVILHETTGHGSGRFAYHIMEEGGDVIEVTDANYNQFVTNDTDSLEELRADIIALFLSVFEFKVLNELGLYKGWYEKLGKEELQKWCIVEMCMVGIYRYAKQKENFTEIIGAHARDNIVLTNYLLEAGAIRVVEEDVTVDNHLFHLVFVEVTNLVLAMKTIIQLVQEVQRIKSTGDGQACEKLFAKYTVMPITIEQGNRYRNYQEETRIKLAGNVKAKAKIYSRYVPVIKNGRLVDICIVDDEDFVTQNLRFDRLMHSTNIE